MSLTVVPQNATDLKWIVENLEAVAQNPHMLTIVFLLKHLGYSADYLAGLPPDAFLDVAEKGLTIAFTIMDSETKAQAAALVDINAPSDKQRIVLNFIDQVFFIKQQA